MSATAASNVASIADDTAVRLGFDPQRLARVGLAIRSEIAAGRCDGVALKVARHGETVLDLCEGYSDRAAGRALDADAVFASMSVAKQFTNVLALSLVERGLLKLHAPVAELITGFGGLGKEKVNLFHLLTHTSGIMSAIPPVTPEVLGDIERLTEYACTTPLESLPGERVNYSLLLGHCIIAALCLRADGRGRSYAQMLADEIFEPLGMRDTSLGGRADLVPRLCPVTIAYPGEAPLIPAAGIAGVGALITQPGVEIPGGGCMTTAADVQRFAEMLRRGGELDGVRLLSPAMLEFCTQNHTGTLRNTLFDLWMGTRGWLEYPAHIGCGFFLRGTGNVAMFFSPLNSPRSYGGFGAGSTGFTVDPERDLTLTFLSSGLMEDSYHFERLGTVATMVLAAMID